MSKSFVQITTDVSKALATLRKENPETMQGFGAMAKGALKDGALTEPQKELIAPAIAVSQRCDACIGFHINALLSLRASRALAWVPAASRSWKHSPYAPTWAAVRP